MTTAEKHEIKTPCPLCNSASPKLFYQTSQRNYYRCEVCDLTFVPKHFHLTAADEKKIYDYHQNDPEDKGYRKFLSRLTNELIPLLNKPAEGLDFGSGPGPTLSIVLGEQGFPTENYDLYYAHKPELLHKQYDFITSTEVFEHLSQPKEVLTTLVKCLKPGGILGLMTKRTPANNFGDWHYIKDPTHITFYSDLTFEFISREYQCKLIMPSSDTALLIKR